MTSTKEKAKRARLLEERRALRYAISLLRDLGIDTHVKALERLSRKLYSAAPDYEPTPPPAAMPRDPIAQYVSHVFRMGRKTHK